MTHQEVISEIQKNSLAVAVKQAMRYELGLTFAEIVGQTGVHMKSVCSHVYAKRGSNVARWEDRTEDQRRKAVELAQKLINAPV